MSANTVLALTGRRQIVYRIKKNGPGAFSAPEPF